MLKSREFEFRHAPNMERTAENLFERAGSIRVNIEDFLGFSFEEQVLVILTPDKETFFSLQGRRAPEWASGTAYPTRRVIFLRPLDAGEIRGNNINTIFSHELSHILLFHRLKGRHPPRWLDEGVAMHLSGEMLLLNANQLLGVGVTGRHIPFSMLTHSFPASGDQAGLAYAQSADMVSYIRREFPGEAFFSLLDRIADGYQFDEALNQSLGISMAQLEKNWLRSVRRRWGLVPLLTGSISLWFMISILFIAAYIRKRRISKARRELWEIEEQLDAVSSETDHERYLH